jgi:hypothetical protein
VFLGLCAIALLVAVPLTGGSLNRVVSLPFRGVRWLVGGLLLQVLVISVLTSLPHSVAVAGHIASYAMLGWAVWLNRMLPGVLLIAAGAACNGVTIALNDGTLPASRSALRAAGIPVRDGFTNSGIVGHPHLAWLGDVMVTPSWLPMRNMLSVGDLLLLLGAAVLVMVAAHRKPAEVTDPVDAAASTAADHVQGAAAVASAA